MSRYRVAIVGAGNVGLALAELLTEVGDRSVVLIDGVVEAIDRAAELGFAAELCDAVRVHDLRHLLDGSAAVVAATPEAVVPHVVAAARSVGANALDLSTDEQEGVVTCDPAAPTALSRCGVSPGLIGALTADLLKAFGSVDDLVVRVGAIPQVPTNRLGYGRIWNVDGLIAEYTRPSEAIVDGRAARLAPLEGLETFALDGRPYEAFVTAGGMPILPGQLAVPVRNATFKTIRHPGHLDYMRFLLDDLGLRGRRDVLANLLMNGLPDVVDDEVLIHITARGEAAGVTTERSASWRIRPERGDRDRRPANALASGAAAHLATLIDLLEAGDVPRLGGARLDDVPIERFLGGRHFAHMLTRVEAAAPAAA
jgi:saccharopine dehydrogenase-like NADP-dependent oxidoreductase